MGFFKNFMLKQALKAKMKDVPEEQREKLMEVMEKNPEIFEKIGEEVKRLTKSGQSEMAATMIVMRKYQAELQKLMLE
jgi:hypothetical protein